MITSKRNTKEDIFREAAKLFHEKGYSATSVRALAAAVGIEAPSLYSHIASKSQLLEEICLDIADKFIEGIAVIKKAECSPTEKIKMVISHQIEMALSEPKSITAFNQEWRHLDGEALKKYKRLRKKYEAVVLSFIEDGQRCKEIVDIDSRIILNTLLSGMRWIYFSKPSELRKRQSELESTWGKIFLEGLNIT